MARYLYVVYDKRDDLPVYVEREVELIAQYCGCHRTTVWSSYTKGQNVHGTNYYVVRVVDDETNDD